MELSNISWPVFRLSEHKPRTEGEIVFYSKEYVDLETGEHSVGMRVVDDKSVQGETLGRRRIQLQQDESLKLFPIRVALYYLQDLIKVAKATTWFIDNSGSIFQYRKTTRAKLSFHRIKKLFPVEGLGYIIELENIPQRFKCLFKPNPEQGYAGVLHWGLGYILYGFYHEQLKPSYRRV